MSGDREAPARTAPEAAAVHPSAEQLALFMAGDLPRDDAREVVRHLLSGCARCRRETGAWWPKELIREGSHRKVVPMRTAAERQARQPRDYSPMFQRVASTLAQRERAFSDERTHIPELRRELLALSPDERLERVESDPRFHGWGLAESLLQESRDRSVSEPAEAVALAEVATRVADHLDEERYSTAAASDLRAQAWSQLGNALRVQTLMPDAQKALDVARGHLERGSGDPAERCRLLVLQAALYGDLKRFDEAFALLDRVIALAERSGEDHLRGSALIRKARLAQRRDDPETAVELLRQGVGLIDPDQDPRLVLVAGHNLVHLLVDTGRYREALSRLDQTRVLHRQLGGRLDFVRFRWLEAKVFHGLGWLGKAQSGYTEVRQSFIDEGLGYDMALVSLDLATVHSHEGNTAEVRRLAEEMLPIFRAQNAHQEAIAALLFFRDAARRETASVSLIREVADYLRRSRANPDLPFRTGRASTGG